MTWKEKHKEDRKTKNLSKASWRIAGFFIPKVKLSLNIFYRHFKLFKSNIDSSWLPLDLTWFDFERKKPRSTRGLAKQSCVTPFLKQFHVRLDSNIRTCSISSTKFVKNFASLLSFFLSKQWQSKLHQHTYGWFSSFYAVSECVYVLLSFRGQEPRIGFTMASWESQQAPLRVNSY